MRLLPSGGCASRGAAHAAAVRLLRAAGVPEAELDEDRAAITPHPALIHIRNPAYGRPQMIARNDRAALGQAEHSSAHLLAAALGSRRRFRPAGRAAAGALGPAERRAFEGLLARRLAREPVQYIVGDWDFRDGPGPTGAFKRP
jgi:methylase of polypeptide subunit release factors